jgi:YidC/Oxa1 family membrane protein insertase
MDRIRFALWFALVGSIWLAYATWVGEQAPPPSAASAATGTQTIDAADGVPPITAGDSDVPALTAPGADVATADAETETMPAELITVRTDVLDLAISLTGGDIVRADLPVYPVHKDRPDEPVRLLDYTPATYWGINTGIAANGPSPDHQQPFTAERDAYELADNADTLTVVLAWTGPDGLRGEKRYTFRRGEYAVEVELTLTNGSNAPVMMAPYAQMRREETPNKRKFLDIDSYSFHGPVWYDGAYTKLKFDDLQKQPARTTVADGWIAGIQHHFLSAVIPLTDDTLNYTAEAIGSRYRLRVAADATTIASGTTFSFPLRLFLGPKLQDQLQAAAPDRQLKRTVDYGKLYFLSNPLFLILDFIHGWVRNWGVSIILTTFLIKLVFYKLTATSGRSMAKMRKLAPRMKALQEKHKDDRQAYGAAMMELYKKEKVNPAAGCLPILIQMPFFFAFYWVLVESVEMRQAPFMLWINDLSVKDPLFILPGLMMAAMWFQMRLNPTPPDPVQARVMQIMPFFFAAMFAFFPAGLVLYWLTNTVVSIAQQWRINQLVARES